MLVACPLTAAAHIHLTTPLARTDSLDGDQKDEHCGVIGQARTTRVTTYKPGQTVMISWLETVNHTGWYRIALQPNGDVFPIPQPSNGPSGVGVPSTYPTLNQEGTTDAATGAIILKDRIPDGMLMTQVTMPDIECNNCTLQFIQLMNETATYEPAEDIYFNCADIVLANGAPGAPDAGPGAGDTDAGTGGTSATTGGCSTGGGAGLLAGLALFGLVANKRRRRGA